GALLCFFLWESKESRAGADRLWYVFCFALGLATLAKGLVGVVLPLMIIAPYLILTGAWRSLLRPRLIIFGALIFLATAAVWYAPVIARNGRGFIDEFFIGHHFQRYLSNKYRHPQPFYFFPMVVVAGSFPWSFYLLWSVGQTIAKVSAQVFAPEALRRLAGGGAQRNHRNQWRNPPPAPEGRQTEIGLSPLRGWGNVSDRVRWFLYRLISAVPPGQRVIPNLDRKFNTKVWPTDRLHLF